MKLSAVYAIETGHVVGALAATGVATPGIGALVGEALPVPVTLPRDRTPVDVRVPASRLTTTAADRTPDTRGVLARPLRYGVRPVAGVPTVEPLLRWPSSADPVVVAADGVTVTLPEPAPQPTPVLVLLCPKGGATVTLPVRDVATGQRAVTLPASLASGDYGVLTLVAGWEGRLDTASLP